MTLDCRGINIKDPGRFRTEADNLEEQLCCFNIENNDRCLNAFLGKTIRNRELSTDAIHFQTKRVKIIGQKITVERLTQLQNWKTLSVIAQAYLDMVGKNKSVEKQKAAPAVEEEKEVSKT